MISAQRAEQIREAYERNRRAAEAFDPKRFKRGGGYTPADLETIAKMAGVKAPSNEELGQLEFFDFMTKKPDEVFAYYSGSARIGDTVTNFPGLVLGQIVWRGHETKPMGGRAVSVRVRGANGVLYAGRCNLSSGTYCRLKRMATS